jgi:predicted nicotinamide N-methyase
LPPRDLVEETVVLSGRDLSIRRPRDAEALLDEEAFEHEEYLPYWAELWPSGLALARELAPRALRGARTLELGCGLGLPSFAAALAGGRVLATDWAPDAVALVEENAARNGIALEVLACAWERPDAIVHRAPWDLVLGADLLYEARNVDALLTLLPRLAGSTTQVWIADPGRAPATPFLERAAEDWDVDSVPAVLLPQGAIHRLRPRAATVGT